MSNSDSNIIIPPVSALAESAFHHIICSHCRKPFDGSSESFYVTICTHIICSTCLFPNEAIPSNTNTLIVSCPTCKTPGRILKLEEGETDLGGFRYCFRPIRELLDELGIALEFQVGTLKEQLTWLKDRLQKQRLVLNKIKYELEKSRDIKNRNTALESENTSLKEELAQARHSLNYQHATAAPDLMRPPFVGDNARKRKASPLSSSRNSRPNMNEAPIESRNRQANAPLQPHRLSLSPNHAIQHSARQYQASLQRSDAGSRSNHSPGQRPTNVTSAKERLSEFTYDPNAHSRPPSIIPHGEQTQLSSHHQNRAPPNHFSDSHSSRGDQPPPSFSTARTHSNHLPSSHQVPFRDQSNYSTARNHLPPPASPRPNMMMASGSAQRRPFIAPDSRGITPMPVNHHHHQQQQQHPSYPLHPSRSTAASPAPHSHLQPPSSISRPPSAFTYRPPPPPPPTATATQLIPASYSNSNRDPRSASVPPKLVPRFGGTGRFPGR